MYDKIAVNQLAVLWTIALLIVVLLLLLYATISTAMVKQERKERKLDLLGKGLDMLGMRAGIDLGLEEAFRDLDNLDNRTTTYAPLEE